MPNETPNGRPDSGNGDSDSDRDRDDRRPDSGPHVESPDLAELIRYMAVNLVERPDEVRVELVEERTANVYELEVAEPDLGKVIGRGGKTARALRTIVQAVAPRSRKRTLVEILE
ncbi:MAG: KH domain-containing protein [Deltaproteobacteria bacterium]|nr:KH domain-containing protein [Deltaproteobacteria bacterium]